MANKNTPLFILYMGFFKNFSRRASSLGNGLIRRIDTIGTSISRGLNHAADMGSTLVDRGIPIADKILAGAKQAGNFIHKYGKYSPVFSDAIEKGGEYLAKGADMAEDGLDQAKKVDFNKIRVSPTFHLEPERFKSK